MHWEVSKCWGGCSKTSWAGLEMAVCDLLWFVFCQDAHCCVSVCLNLVRDFPRSAFTCSFHYQSTPWQPVLSIHLTKQHPPIPSLSVSLPACITDGEQWWQMEDDTCKLFTVPVAQSLAVCVLSLQQLDELCYKGEWEVRGVKSR